MKQHLNEVKRMQKLAGLINENRLLENEAFQAEVTADKVADKLEDKIDQLSPEQINQLKADLDKLGITADTPAEEVVDKIEGPLSEAEGDEKQKIASALSDAGGGLMKSMLVPLIPLAVGGATGLGFLGGLGITIATAGLLLGLAKALKNKKSISENDRLSEIRQLVKEVINESLNENTYSFGDKQYIGTGEMKTFTELQILRASHSPSIPSEVTPGLVFMMGEKGSGLSMTSRQLETEYVPYVVVEEGEPDPTTPGWNKWVCEKLQEA